MHCPRLDHFVRLNQDGTLSRCGHMVNAAKFATLDELESSVWLQEIKDIFALGQWPKECVRCQQTEQLGQGSIRINSIDYHNRQHRSNYLIVGGILDNICNSACQFCNATLSTKIGGLQSRVYQIVDNSSKFDALPKDRIVHLDINGGEPSASKNYKKLLKDLPATCESVRINTNCSLIIDEVDMLVEKGIDVTITVSFDGTGTVHDYVRWPIKWKQFEKNLQQYLNKPVNLNLWTTVNTLNLCDLENIFNYASKHKIDHSWALLNQPTALNATMTNSLTTKYKEILSTSNITALREISKLLATDKNNEEAFWQYVQSQDALRNINYDDYYTQSI